MNDNDQTLTELENPIFFAKVKGVGVDLLK